MKPFTRRSNLSKAAAGKKGEGLKRKLVSTSPVSAAETKKVGKKIAGSEMRRKLKAAVTASDDKDIAIHRQADEDARAKKDAARGEQRVTTLLARREKVKELLSSGQIDQDMADSMLESINKSSEAPTILTGKNALPTKKGQITTTVNLEKLRPSEVEDVGQNIEKEDLKDIDVM